MILLWIKEVDKNVTSQSNLLSESENVSVNQIVAVRYPRFGSPCLLSNELIKLILVNIFLTPNHLIPF